jgi:hypothetical protein
MKSVLRLQIEVLLFVFVIACDKTFSQASNQFIIPVNLAGLRLNESQSSMLERARKNPFCKSIRSIRLSDLSKCQRNGVLKFTIPGRSGEIEARAKYVKSYSALNYEWFGTIDNELGSMAIICRNGKITGNISMPGEMYEIYHTNNDLHLLSTFNVENAKKENKCSESEILNKSTDLDGGGYSAT